MKNFSLLALDTETTGLDTATARIWELGLATRTAGRVTAATALLSPGVIVPAEIITLSHISQELLEKIYTAPKFPAKIEKIRQRITTHLEEGGLLLTYNGSSYDLPLLNAECDRYHVPRLPITPDNHIDALIWIREGLPKVHPKTLSAIAALLHIPVENAHRAWADAKTTLLIGEKLRAQLPAEIPEIIAMQARIKKLQDMDRERYSFWLRCRNGQLFMACGKHAGKPVEQVDRGYWGWLFKQHRAYNIAASKASACPVDQDSPVDTKGRKLEPIPEAVLEVARRQLG